MTCTRAKLSHHRWTPGRRPSPRRLRHADQTSHSFIHSSTRSLMPEFDGREDASRRGYRLSRRSIVKGVAMLPLATAGLVGSTAYAAPSPTGEQAPGFYRFRVGSYELTNIYDGELARQLDASLIPNASPDDILPVIAAAGLPTDH